LTETENVSVELETPLRGHFQDRYESYPCIYVGEDDANLIEKWSFIWDEHMTTLGLADSSKVAEPGGEQVCTTMCAQPPYCIDSGSMSHCSPVHSDFIDLTPIHHCAVCGMNGSAFPAIGIGTIKLQCRKCRRLMLKSVLLVPDAAL